MTLERMRKVDYWLGIPLLFCLSACRKIQRLFSKEKYLKPENVLFIELSEMGSAVLAEPAMKYARQVFDATIYFCIFKRNAQCLTLLDIVDENRVYVIRDDKLWHFILDVLGFRYWCLRHGIDSALDLELFSRFSALLTFWSGARNRVGFDQCHNEGLYRGQVHNHPVWYNAHCHIAQNYLSLVKQLATGSTNQPYSKTAIDSSQLSISKLPLDAKVQHRIRQRLTKQLTHPLATETSYIVININDGGLIPQRNWPRTHFVELICQLLSFDKQARILLSGTREAHIEAEIILKLVIDPRCYNITGLFSIPELPYLYNLAKLMISSDSGPAHFAAVTTMPVIALFGPETPNLYRPLGTARILSAQLACSPCVSAANHRNTQCNDNQCMQMIRPEQVLSEVRRIYEAPEIIPIKQNRKTW